MIDYCAFWFAHSDYSSMTLAKSFYEHFCYMRSVLDILPHLSTLIY